jgi:isoleucyl-tRNA synthetase
MTAPMTGFGILPSDRPADELERELLSRWDEEGLFELTLEKNTAAKPWVFFEGPPTANGKPGIHHVFSRTIKDLFCRHRAMKGYRVARKAGWDTHGLPVEIEVEKQLGISGKQQIEALGVAEFNRLCRESVFRYRTDWEKLSARIGYWLDYEHPYVTFTPEYVESVWWALATLYERDLLYRGHKILPYCPRCGTALSSHELALGYKDVEDPSVYVALDVVDGSTPTNRRILVWTTTPWTLVSNVALAVHPDLEYVEVVRRTGEDRRTLILAESRLRAVLGEDFDNRWDIVGRLKGDEMVGWRYRRPFDWLEYPEGKQHEIVIGEEFVSAGDGSGVVHMAPAFGQDDYAAGQKHDLAFLLPVGPRGEFPSDLPVAGGEFVKDADPLLIEELKRRGVLFKAGRITHSYPHCWRCDTPLLYYARTSWFVKTSSYKDAMLARNARVNWNPPEVGAGRFGEWLQNNIDWAISRDRYWGTPLPVWVCETDASHVDVIGSFATLAERVAPADAGSLPPGSASREHRARVLSHNGEPFDPHKPNVDAFSWRCTHEGCTGTMRRVPEVIDTWFDSGSMSFAQWHYPFENAEKLADQFPADFIAEGVDQTRGWFYSLLAIATGLGDALPNNSETPSRAKSSSVFDTAPYRAVVVNDLVLDPEGAKMAKSKGNVVNPWEALARHGADAVRLFFVASSNVWVPRRFDEKLIREQAGRFLLTLKNVYFFFAQYANFGWTPSEQDPPVEARRPTDKWVLGRVATLTRDVDDKLEHFDATGAARAIIEFVDDDLANWYVRLNRARFYEVDDDDNRAAFATLHEVLVVVCRLLAPLAPFLPDWLHRELTGSSVHLAPFGGDVARHDDPALDRAMAAVRTLARLGRAAREEAGVKVRIPLSRLVCVAPGVDMRVLELLVPLIETELNVKRVEFATSGDALVQLEAKPNFRSLGKKFGKKTPLAAAAIAAFTSDELRAFEHGEPLAVTVDGESHLLDAEDLTIVRRASGPLVVQEDSGFFAAIDPTVTEDLRLEGAAREVISRVQRMRKEAGLSVSDRINLTVAGGPEVQELVRVHGKWISAEVLAAELEVLTELGGGYLASQTLELDGFSLGVALTKVQ